ncbi:IS3 family transposase [Enterococcus cecorum]|nr:IS3 family transposase [Enterococcus cecorum]
MRIRECLFKRTEEAAFRGRGKNEERHSSSTVSDEVKTKRFSLIQACLKQHICIGKNDLIEKILTKNLKKKSKSVRIIRITDIVEYMEKLHNQGYLINKKKVQRIVQKLTRVTSYTRKSRKYSSYKGRIGTIAPNRIHEPLALHIPHQKITTDTLNLSIMKLMSKDI